MNILCIAEHYAKGGLETHIKTFYHALEKNHKVIFAFNEYTESNCIKDAKIYNNFKFSAKSTIKEFLEDVNNLIEIIKKEKIDIIHIHPFYCLFPAIFAANETNTKVAYTIHGRSSITFPSYANDTILFEFCISEFISNIFCVSKSYCYWLNNHDKKNIFYLPNLIDEESFKNHKPSLNKKWALISRLDKDKKEEIIRLLIMLRDLDIAYLDIYGNGSCEKELQAKVEKLNLTNVVTFKGYIENLNEELQGYTGIIGQGRVVLEGLVMNYPTFIMGYNKIAGLIDKKTYHNLSILNFVPSYLEDKTLEEINKELIDINKGKITKYQMRNEVIKDFGLHKINEYINMLKTSNKTKIDTLSKALISFKEITNQEENFYLSQEVFYILSNNISSFTMDIKLKNTINIYTNLYKSVYTSYCMLEEKLNKIYEKINELENNIEKQSNTSLKTLVERDIKKLGTKIKVKK